MVSYNGVVDVEGRGAAVYDRLHEGGGGETRTEGCGEGIAKASVVEQDEGRGEVGEEALWRLLKVAGLDREEERRKRVSHW